LTALPGAAVDPLPPGQYQLEIGADKDGWFYIPPGTQAGQFMPLVVMLHGAGGNARNWDGARKWADSLGIVLLAPDSRGRTWDIVGGAFGLDVQFLHEALVEVFHHALVDPSRIALSGFSDGASYALSLGLANGDLFTNVIAWSPGFMIREVPRGQPGIYVSHGTLDPILSFEYTSQVLVPQLREAGLEVVFEQFDGAHEITAAVAQNAFDWFLAQ
jgi:predicted esterase